MGFLKRLVYYYDECIGLDLLLPNMWALALTIYSYVVSMIDKASCKR